MNDDYYTALAPLAAHEDELGELQDEVADLLDGHRVLELASGDGFWTDTLVYCAKHVTAVEADGGLRAQAHARGFDPGQVTSVQADPWQVEAAPGQFTACFSAGLWSHLPREAQDKFLKQLRAKLGKDVLLVFIGENFVEGESRPIARTDAEGNTWQIVSAPDGGRIEVLQNFLADSVLRKRFAVYAREVRIERTAHYWMLTCRFK